MKITSRITRITSIFGILLGASMAMASTPHLISADFHTGYLPNGFDSNDHVQVVAEGLFSNTCYKPAPSDFEVNHEQKTITLKAMAYHYDAFCAQVLVPYHQVFDLGLMHSGSYKIQTAENTQLGTLKVRPAVTASADDFLYAPVSQAYYRKNDDRHLILLNGEFTNSCMQISDVKLDLQERVVVLQPISEFRNRGDCQTGRFPFEKAIELPAIKAGRYLLHVRSLNAKAINNLIDIR